MDELEKQITTTRQKLLNDGALVVFAELQKRNKTEEIFWIFSQLSELIPVEGMPKCYKYRGTPEQLRNQSKIKILSAKVTITDE